MALNMQSVKEYISLCKSFFGSACRGGIEGLQHRVLSALFLMAPLNETLFYALLLHINSNAETFINS